MKKILLSIVTVSLLASCSNYTIQLSNGAKITAKESNGKSYTKGEKVCIRSRGLTNDWSIDNSGMMADTTITYKYANRPGIDSGAFVIEYKTGQVVTAR